MVIAVLEFSASMFYTVAALIVLSAVIAFALARKRGGRTMVNGQNYFEALYANQVNQSELEQIVSMHFGRAAAISLQQIEYRHSTEGPAALTFSYNGDGALVAIRGEAGLKTTDIAELQSDIRNSLLAEAPQNVGRRVLFAHVPTVGCFRYKDVFQLRPVPPDAPRPVTEVADHPLVLEFRCPGTTNGSIRVLRFERVAKEIELLCASLISEIKGTIGKSASYHWVIPKSDDPNSVTSEYLQELYIWPHQWAHDAEEFSTCEGIPAMDKVASDQYYLRRGIWPDQKLAVPQNLEYLLDAFFALKRDMQDRFLRACFWFRHAHHVYTASQSASFASLVSAIETLMGPPPAAGTTCPTCGKEGGPGPTRRFADFVEKFAADPASTNAERRKLYSLRSALSHGSKLLPGDRSTWSPGLTPDLISQWQDTDAMWQIVRVSLINWLQDSHAE
jgi:hypothetical protein